MSPSDWHRINEARGFHRVEIAVGSVFKPPYLLLACAGMAILTVKFGGDFPILHVVAVPTIFLLTQWSLGAFRRGDSRRKDHN
ncbi:hypothetical protein ACH4M4_38060 [Streptomyces sp. NPDC017254]|uniref:hypothetical protein n=1 Tax=unclassified Streptomyces TaxID=2593676 RepID=UPI0037B5F5FE